MNKEDIEKGLMACVHCGFCLQACPTYRETGDEADSPRGRLVLMSGVHGGTLRLDDAAQLPGGAGYHLDRCLGCRACETACPSGVPYGQLLEHFRDQQEKNVSRPLGERLLRDGLLGTLTSPGRMALALRAGKLTGGRIPATAARFLGLPENTALPLPDDLKAAGQPLPEITPARGDKRGRVALLAGCVMKVMYAPIHHATARVLSANGIEVFCPRDQGCCGALHGHQGRLHEARQLARELIVAFENEAFDALVVNSAGCGSMMKDYGHLLKDDPAWAGRAQAFVDKVRDVTEYLAAIGPRPMPTSVSARVTYHDACHLAHGQKIAAAPRQLLKAIPGITYVELGDADQCCGSAGVYNFLQPEMARALQQRKVEHIRATGAEIVAAANPGCLAWIAQGMEKTDGDESAESAGDAKPLEIVHPIELLDRAYEG